jgi:ABC-type dipeptide/oligopeptide/nickel transport system permease component
VKRGLTIVLKREVYSFSLTIVGIFLIGSLPYLFFNYDVLLKTLVLIDTKKLDNADFLYDTFTLNLSSYFHHILQTIVSLKDVWDYEYYSRGAHFPLFPELLRLFGRSSLFLISSIILGTLTGVIIVFLTMLLRYRYRKNVKRVLLIIESLPDIFVILLMQQLIIWLYKRTHILFLNIVDVYQDPAYVLPVICLSVLPAVYITKYLLLTFEDEEKRDYVEFAKSKGISVSRIILIHIARNSIITFFNHFKSIFWFALSNLLMLEIIFDLPGFTTFVQANVVRNPEIITYTLLMVFLPFYLFFITSQMFIKKYTGTKEV